MGGARVFRNTPSLSEPSEPADWPARGVLVRLLATAPTHDYFWLSDFGTFDDTFLCGLLRFWRKCVCEAIGERQDWPRPSTARKDAEAANDTDEQQRQGKAVILLLEVSFEMQENRRHSTWSNYNCKFKSTVNEILKRCSLLVTCS